MLRDAVLGVAVGTRVAFKEIFQECGLFWGGSLSLFLFLRRMVGGEGIGGVRKVTLRAIFVHDVAGASVGVV